jgi:hypothetical protein
MVYMQIIARKIDEVAAFRWKAEIHALIRERATLRKT